MPVMFMELSGGFLFVKVFKPEQANFFMVVKPLVPVPFNDLPWREALS